MGYNVSEKCLKYWQDYVEKHKSQNLKWHKKMESAWARTRKKHYKKSLAYYTPRETWKLAHLLILSHIKNKLNWQPNVSLHMGLRKVLDNF